MSVASGRRLFQPSFPAGSHPGAGAETKLKKKQTATSDARKYSRSMDHYRTPEQERSIRLGLHIWRHGGQRCITTPMRQTSPPAPGLPIAETLERHVQVLRHHHLTALDETQDTAEAIHKARVTTRRLQADLDLLQFGRNIPVVRNVKQRLRDFRNGLSTVRNYDVLIEIVHAHWNGRTTKISPISHCSHGRLREERDRESEASGQDPRNISR